MGFEEIQHTADWSIRVWSQDLPGLFAEAARGMYALAGVVIHSNPEESRRFDQEGPDPESLLIAFLSELIYYQEQEHLVFTKYDLRINQQHLSVLMQGGQMASLDKSIKAVTWHNLKIEKTGRGFETEIVFDV